MATRPERQIRELREGETIRAYEAMRALRSDLESAEQFVKRVDEALRPSGYRLIGAFTHGRDQAVAVASARTGESLAWGRYLYVDDLCTVRDCRRQGHAGALLEWLVHEGRRLGCGQLHLDSGTGPPRFDAHRLYHRHGLVIYAHHFVLRL
jgi:GNAT superfamily N-acetyltransferase